MTGAALFAAVFLACAVEAVEATTIVLAAGTTRDWRSALQGLAAGVAVLVVVVAALGPAISSIPLRPLRLVIGGLLLVFGLQWLRKAVLRASGHKALHDEDAIYARQVAAAAVAGHDRRGVVGDWYAFTLSFKGVVLEGLEVAFIALTFGSNSHDIPLAAVAGLAAIAVVAAAGVAVRAPLARVPENTMKFVVGVMLTSFGMFWGGEGAGAHWPGSDAALLVIVPGVAIGGLVLSAVLRQSAPPPVRGGSVMRRLRGLAAFWYDFVVGDDWVTAVGVVVALAVTWALSTTSVPAWWLLPVGVAALLSLSLWRAVRPGRR